MFDVDLSFVNEYYYSRLIKRSYTIISVSSKYDGRQSFYDERTNLHRKSVAMTICRLILVVKLS